MFYYALTYQMSVKKLQTTEAIIEYLNTAKDYIILQRTEI